MAKDKQKKTKKESKIKKKWCTILAPDIFNKIPIGESIVSDPSQLVGRQVEVNLMNLTRNVRQQNINVKFQITKIQDKDVETEIIKYEMAPSSIKRIVRRSITRIDESFVVLTSDNKRLRIKPLVITRSKLKKSVERDMRKAIKNYITTEIKKMDYIVLVKDIITNKFQKSLAETINKIHPVRITTIRSIYIEEEKKKKVKTQKKKGQKLEEIPEQEKLEEKKEEAKEESKVEETKEEKEEPKDENAEKEEQKVKKEKKESKKADSKKG